MKLPLLWLIALVVLPAFNMPAQDRSDTSEHTVQFVTVDKDVKLEVLDWGGTGRPLVFLAGLGSTAHVYDQFAPKFTAKHHVYGITRRGFGESSKPATTTANYAADRLGDDVLAVIDALKLDRPVLAGHSIAGEELSSVGSRHPEKVAGLIYLEAGYGYAHYSRPGGELSLDMAELGKEIEAQKNGALLDQHNALAMQTGAAQLQHDLEAMTRQMALVPNLPEPSPVPPVVLAVQFGEQKYAEVAVPALAIFACPHNFDFPGATAAIKDGMSANDLVSCTAQSKAFAAGIPTAHVVLLPGAEHMVFRSNEADVIREMSAFLATLP